MIIKDKDTYTAADFVPAVTAYLRRTGYTACRPVTALCDMDGTLYDSMPRHADAWRRMMLEQGLDIPRDRFFLLEGRTGADTINVLFREACGRTLDAEQCKALYDIKARYFREFQQKQGIAPIPGAQRLTRWFMDNGITPVLVTGSGQSSLLGRLQADYPGAFPDNRRVTSHNVTHGKPNPEPYLHGLELAGVTADQAIVLENAPLGVEAGVAARVFTVAVHTGPIPLEALDAAGADIVFGDMPHCADAFPALIRAMKATALQHVDQTI